MTIPVAASVFRRYATDGVPSSGPNDPDKTQIIALLTALETLSNIGAGLAYSTAAAAAADLAHPANTLALVYNDATAANNGMYVKSGASGIGSWSRAADLPTSLVRLTVTGGTGDAIIATAPESPTLPGSKLYLLAPTSANTTTTSIMVNSAAPVAIKNAFGLDLAANSLVISGQVLMAWQTDHYQILISAQVDASSILASALAAATAASASATAAASSASALGNQVAQYDTRAAAIAATIPGGVNFVRTLAYDSSFTENSGATFKRVASGTPFLDTWPLTGTIAGGSGYTNGTYYGVPIGGSANGSGMFATVTVAGGAVTAVDHSTQPGNGYKVGDVMSQISAYIGGTGSGFTYTIATMSSPLASFVNAVDSSRWQYVQSKGFTHVNEFGAKADWSSTDAGTTNNFAAIQTALFFAVRNLTGTAQDAGGFQGDIVKCGVGSYMLMHPSNLTMLIVPDGVYLEGVYGTTLKINDGWYQAQHCIALGNPNGHFANFNCGLRHIRLFYKRGINVAAGTFMVYSNSIQDGGGMDHVHILAGQRGGFKYEIGYGGASTVKFHDLSIDIEGPTSAADFNVGTTIVDCRLWSLGSPSGGRNDTTNAVTLSGTGGMYRFDGIHAELYPNGFLIDLRAGNNPMASFKNCTGGCGILFTILGTSQPGSFSFEQCQKNNGASGAILISNGMSGGSPRASDIRPSDGVVGY